MASVVINFDNERAAEHFASWLSGQGEQDYWLWMQYREEKEDGLITAETFKYNYEAVDGVVRIDTVLGRTTS